MSAREELFEALMPLYRAQYAPGEEESTNALIDAFAHELAEKIRAEVDDLDGWPEEQNAARKYANLIDPEVAKP